MKSSVANHEGKLICYGKYYKFRFKSERIRIAMIDILEEPLVENKLRMNSFENMNSIMKLVQKILEIMFRNSIILSMLNVPAKRNRINLNWAPVCKVKYGGLNWRVDTEQQNFGDYLAVVIYKYMLDRYHLDMEMKRRRTIHLYTLGSILLLGHQDAVVWGSGILLNDVDGLIWRRSRYRKLDIRCVRGPETKRRLNENGYDTDRCLFGDPGVLLPLIYTPVEKEKRQYSVMLHMSKKVKVNNQINILTSDWKTTIDEIYNSKLVISSSLHGIIIAEAYGIPAILLNELEFNDLFKYNDYYYSTGRYEYPICNSIEEALRLPVPKVPDLSDLQHNLLKSFPVDLWND